MSRADSRVRQRAVNPDEAARRRDRFPVGSTIDFDTLHHAGGEATLDALRDAEPITWADPIGHWLVTGYDLAREALRPRTPLTVDSDRNVVRSSLGENMLTVDGDEQRRLRAPFEEPFRMRSVESRYGGVVDGVAAHLIDGFAEAGSCELGAAFAAPFAIRVAGRIVGFDGTDVERIDDTYRAFADAMTYPDDHAAQAAAGRARAAIDALVDAGMTADPNGVAAAVSTMRPRTLDDAEIRAQMRVVLFGAIETVQASIVNTIFLLGRDPNQFAEVREDHTAIPNAVHEAIRLIPPVTILERWVREPMTLGGIDLAVGEMVDVSVLAANRDPAVFPDPTRFDIHRTNASRGLAFAFGAHHCIGMHLALLEATRAIGVLLDRLPGLAVLDADAPFGYSFRRSHRLVVGWNR